MSVTEAQRLYLFKSFEDVLAHEALETLMALLPPAGWGDVATKRDLDAHAALTKRDLDAHAAMTKRDLDAHAALTKRDLDALEASLRKDLDALGVSLRKDLDAAVRELRAEMATKSDLQGQTNRYITWLLGSHVALAGLVGMMLAFD